MERRHDPRHLAPLERTNGPKRGQEPVRNRAPKKPSKPKGQRIKNSFQSLVDLRRNFRAAFASRVLQPGNIAPRIDAMVTAASNAVLVDKKKRKTSSILTVLCKDGRAEPLSVVEAMAFIWVFVGMLDAVRKRNGFNFCTGGDNGQLLFLFKQAVTLDKDKEKNMTHVAILCKKVRQCLPTSSKFLSHIFKGVYGDVDFNTVPTPEAGMEQLFGEMSPFYEKKVPVKKEMMDKSLRPVNPVVDQFFLRYRTDTQKISQKSDQDNLPPKAIIKPSSSSSRPQQKVVPVEAKWISVPIAVKPRTVETASTSKQQRRPPDSVQKIRQPSTSKKCAANLPPKKVDSDFLLFLTNPGEYIKMNPSLFPSNDVSWSAKKVLPEPPRKRNKPNNPADNDEPVPGVAQQSPVDCMETMLRVDFTPEEYIDQTTASNYYAQGVKIVDGVRRVVFYHKMINLSDIKKEESI